MSQERDIQTPSGETLPANEENKKLVRSQMKARLATILERGIVADRLHVDLPDDVYGEWVTDDPLEINRMKSLGFEVDTVYAKKRALHSGGDGASKVGDVVFMTAPREVKDLIDEIKHEQYMKLNSKGVSKEEKDFKAQNEPLGIGGTIVESRENEVQKDDIKLALGIKD